MRVGYALRQHEQCYVGDGAYSDGPDFHWDYYNSFVIQPMLVDIVETLGDQFASGRAVMCRSTVHFMINPDSRWTTFGESAALVHRLKPIN